MKTHKTCSNCRASIPIALFGRNRQTPDGLAYYCKSCAAIRQANWAEKNPDKVKQSREAYLSRVRATNTLRGDPRASE